MRILSLSLLVGLILSFKSSDVQIGKATYYANAFEGRKTSSGEIFSQKLLTAAHKNLPFGTIVQVRNQKNDSIVVVKINDRLPQRSNFVIDVTLTAAKQLNFVRQGIAAVELTIMDPTKMELKKQVELIPATGSPVIDSIK